MPYITNEEVTKIRTELKKQLPEFKMSITRKHYSSVNVALISGPVDFGHTDRSVNQYYIKEHYEGSAREILLKINQIVSSDCRIESTDSDYGSVPNYYINISIGKWDKPYKLNN